MRFRELTILIVATFVALLISVAVLRFFEPKLFSVPTDLQVVRLSKELPPFFDGLFRPEDYQATSLLVKDPIVSVRGKPLVPVLNGLGPHDLMGFRNTGIPNRADIVTIGDSITYGNNAALEENWPSVLSQTSKRSVYNMAVGSWGVAQYFEMLKKCVVLEPKTVVVAIYTGNDPLETFRDVYLLDHLSRLRPDPALSVENMPPIPFPPPVEDFQKLVFKNGREITFTPKHRWLSNDPEHIAVKTGYKLIVQLIKEMHLFSKANQLKTVFVIIPTKETVYKEKATLENLPVSKLFNDLTISEEHWIGLLTQEFDKFGASHLNLIKPLRAAALAGEDLYPANQDGHPLPNGYRVIGEAVASHIATLE